MKNNYVIGIQTFIKLDTLSKLLDSLERCIGVNKYVLIFFIDSSNQMPYINRQHWHELNKNMLDFIHQYSINKHNIYKNILVSYASKNVGPYRGCKILVDICFNYSDYIIFMEDDLILAKDYLLFYECIFDKYIKNDINAICSSAVSFLPPNNQSSQQLFDVRKTKWIDSTEFAMTKSFWNKYGYIRGENRGDIKFGHFIKNHQEYYSIFPAIPRIYKTGLDHKESNTYYCLGKQNKDFFNLLTNDIDININTYTLTEN